jgi:hypothetical protein
MVKFIHRKEEGDNENELSLGRIRAGAIGHCTQEQLGGSSGNG